MLNFSNGDTEFPLPSFAIRAWCALSENKKKKKILTNELWQCHCQNSGIKFFLAIVAMALLKMGVGGKNYEIYERVKKKLSCPQYFYNIFTINHT